MKNWWLFLFSRCAVGPGMGDIANPPPPPVRLSICPSLMFSFQTVTRKHIDVVSQNFVLVRAPCHGGVLYSFDIDGMLFEFFMNFLNIEKNKNFVSIFQVFFAFYAISNIKQNNWC